MATRRTQQPDGDGPAPGADRSVLEVLPVGVVVADLNGSAIHANRAWTDLTGQNPTWRGQGWLQVLEDDRRDHERESLLARARDGQPYEADWATTAGTPARTLHIRAVPDLEGGTVASVVVTAADVTAEREREALLRHQATHDPLTGLFNRAQFLAFLDHALDRLRRSPGQHVAVLFIDLDGLKGTNDSLGHPAGDRLLQQAAARLTALVRPADVVARYGGDEFTILCEDLPDSAEASAIALRISTATLHTGAGMPPSTFSVGYSTADGPDSDPAALVGLADRAMYDHRRERDTTPHRLRLVRPATSRTHSEPGIDQLAIAVHELRTPLALMLGVASTLRESWAQMTPSDIDDALGALDRQGGRLAGTLDGLLHLQRGRRNPTPPTTEVDLDATVADALEVAPPPDHVWVDLSPAPTGPPTVATVSADRPALTLLLVNLLTNAYRAASSTVTITLAPDPGSHVVQIAVEDDGDGVPDDVRPTLFGAFTTRPASDGAEPGTGLGRHIARAIAESLGGRLAHEHARPHGDRFILTLPVP